MSKILLSDHNLPSFHFSHFQATYFSTSVKPQCYDLLHYLPSRLTLWSTVPLTLMGNHRNLSSHFLKYLFQTGHSPEATKPSCLPIIFSKHILIFSRKRNTPSISCLLYYQFICTLILLYQLLYRFKDNPTHLSSGSSFLSPPKRALHINYLASIPFH